MRTSTRQRLTSTASELFYRDGIGPTTIDAIVEAAGLSKPTLYKYFRSKDELVTAVLELRDQEQRRRLAERRDGSENLEERLLAPFRQLVEWGEEADYRGCALVIAALELSEPDHPGRDVVHRHKAWLETYFRDIAAELGADRAQRLARHLMLLLEGGTVQQGVRESSRHGTEALETARDVIAATTRS
ncbi:MAG: TetR/AcrR family transcriptional regulator [Thermoanaerobaculia bacterium]|nr:TetR/AcrR family transcriptional regulator [Thermoanaerobaculia bacterium]